MEKPKKMTDSDLVTVIDNLEQSAVSYREEFMSENEELLRRYNGEPYGDEDEEHSSVISTDVHDLVYADMTSLVRIFLGSGDIMVYEPRTKNPVEIQEAKDKTVITNYIVRKRPDSYKIIYDWLLDTEVQKMGVVHYCMDEETSTEEIEYENLDLIELQEIEAEYRADKSVKDFEIVEQEENDDEEGKYSLTVRVTKKKQEIKIENIPTEDFLLTKNSRCIDTAPFVGHITWKTRGDLVSEGYSEETVAGFESDGGMLNTGDGNRNGLAANRQSMKEIRWRDEGGDLTEEYATWANELIRVTTCYPMLDYDGDGVAERRYILKIGNTIMENEPYNHVPYAVMSALPEAHKAIGNGRAVLALEDQKVKTVLKRNLLDNTYMVNRPRIAATDRVDIDDLLDVRLNGVIRVDKGGNPSQEIFPIQTPYIGDSCLQVIQYIDSARAARAGALMDSQGLDADNLHKETATRFNGVERAAEAKMELVARNMAEIGFRKLFDGICWTLRHYQNTQIELMVLGREMVINPSSWRYDHVATSTVGLGSGSGETTVQNMIGIYNIQKELKAMGSPLVDDKDIYNTLDKIVTSLGQPRTTDFFNDPEVPEQMLMAQLEKVTMALAQSQQLLEQMSQNPLAEAEMIKARARLVEATGKAGIETAKAQSERELKELEMMQKARFKEADLQKEYTKMELEYSTDIPGQGING